MPLRAIWILLVKLPSRGVFQDVSHHLREFSSIADHPFEIIPLPDGVGKRQAPISHPRTDRRLKRAHDRRHRSGNRLPERLHFYRNAVGPAMQQHNAVQMVWHNDKCVQFRVRKVPGNLHPTLAHSSPDGAQLDCVAPHMPEDRLLLEGANRQEIDSGLLVSEPLQANRSPVRSSTWWVHPASLEREGVTIHP